MYYKSLFPKIYITEKLIYVYKNKLDLAYSEENVAKKTASCSRVLVVAEFVISGTHCMWSRNCNALTVCLFSNNMP